MLIWLALLLLSLSGLVPGPGAGVPGLAPVVALGFDEPRKKGAPENDFLVLGTVFTEQGLALPGAAVRVRRAGDRKTRWEARSDRRGEFALRVPKGAEYELSVAAAGYQEQARKIDARAGSREDLVFRLQRASGGKK